MDWCEPLQKMTDILWIWTNCKGKCQWLWRFSCYLSLLSITVSLHGKKSCKVKWGKGYFLMFSLLSKTARPKDLLILFKNLDICPIRFHISHNAFIWTLGVPHDITSFVNLTLFFYVLLPIANDIHKLDCIIFWYNCITHVTFDSPWQIHHLTGVSTHIDLC